MDTLSINRSKFEELVKKRLFFFPAFSIYSGVKGLYDYGPLGCAMKTNLINLWRQHFILEENMLEIESTCLTPSVVLEASGHVDRFTDLMVRDVVTKECYRADHLLKDHLKAMLTEKPDNVEASKDLNTVDDMNVNEMTVAFKKYAIKAPLTNNELSEPFPFNLMFSTSIGPAGNLPGFLRPEIAQGMFVNFANLLQFNNNKLPFAAAQIGQAFRNEIAPRSSLLRVREFTLAEIEYFVDEHKKTHPKFSKVSHLTLPLYPKDLQVSGASIVKITAQEAVDKKIISNELLAYFIVRTYLFLQRIGIPTDKIRFRQHLQNEMAHYAKDCWDAEILTSYGWVECVGHADRSCYDLTMHAKKSGTPLEVFEPLEMPMIQMISQIKPNKQAIGKKYKSNAQTILKLLDELNADPSHVRAILDMFEKDKIFSLYINNEEYPMTPDLVTFVKEERKITGRRFTPHVIEPSFGLGRILYSLLENSYNVRPEDSDRVYLKLPPCIAPIKCCLLPLIYSDKFSPYLEQLQRSLTAVNLSSKIDDTGASVGRRYARNDEIGTPFAVTVDFDTLEDNTVTLRERDCMRQVRIKIHEIPSVIIALVNENMTWKDVEKTYPQFVANSE